MPVQTIDPTEFVEATRTAFVKHKVVHPLRFISAEAEAPYMKVVFHGHADDSRGPFAVKIPLPQRVGDAIWNQHTETNLISEWVLYGVVFRILETYETSFDTTWPRDADGVRWLDLF
jgi:hypothetical protein